MHREPETDIFFSHSPPCFETGTLSDSAGLAGRQALGNSSHGISGARIAGACRAFYLGVGDPNKGSHACTVGTLLTETPPSGLHAGSMPLQKLGTGTEP